MSTDSGIRAAVAAVIMVFLLAGCFGLWPDDAPRVTYVPTQGSVPLSDSRAVHNVLLQQLREWQGVPYQEGGLSKRGVDCSGFVYLTYLSRFGMRLPRTTRGQAAVGRPVSQRELRPGDLLFFHTKWKTDHAAIYLGNGQFIHASTSRGVMASDLSNPYWRKAYWKAVRVGQ